MELMVLNNLAKAIKDKGLTQAQFADRLGADQAVVSRMCRQKSFTLQRLQEILVALNETDVSKVVRVVEVKK